MRKIIKCEKKCEKFLSKMALKSDKMMSNLIKIKFFCQNPEEDARYLHFFRSKNPQ